MELLGDILSTAFGFGDRYAYIMTTVIIELVVVATLSVSTGMYIIVTTRAKRRAAKRTEHIDAALVEISLAAVEAGDHNDYFGDFRKQVRNMPRTLVRDRVLAMVENVVGAERQIVISLYGFLLFRHDDLRELNSRSVLKKVDAILRLGKLRVENNAPYFENCINDPSEVVTLAGIQGLSGVAQAIRPPVLTAIAVKWADKRRDIVAEVMLNFGTQRGAEPLVDILRELPPGKAREVCVLVLGQLRAAEAVPELIRVLEGSNSLYGYADVGDMVVTVAEALGNIGDPTSIPALVKLLDHPDERARATAARSLHRLGEGDGLLSDPSITQDGAISVMRVLQGMRTKREAA